MTVTTTVRLPQQLAEELEMAARVDGVAVSHAIREAIEAHLAKRKADPQFQAAAAAMVARYRALSEALSSPIVDALR